MHEKWRREHIFIPINQVTTGQNITYANPVYDYLPRKYNPYHVRLTIGGDNINYPSNSGSPSATLLEAKFIFDRLISTPGSWFICADIKDYFLCSHIERFEYIKIPFHWILEDICIQYNLFSLVEPDGYMYCKVIKGMYKIKQSDCLTFDHLVTILAPDINFPVRESPGLCNHQTHPMLFSLCVEDIVIKANSLDDAHHIINAIKNISNDHSIGKVKITFV